MLVQDAVALSWETNHAAALWTSRAAGSLGHAPPKGLHNENCCGDEANSRRQQIKTGAWIPCAQVHGSEVAIVDEQTNAPTVGSDSPRADALVCSSAGVNLSIATADCGPLALFSDSVIGAVHAGWKGLYAGVIAAAAREMQRLGATKIDAVLGPCICAPCYEFADSAQLESFAKRWGPSVLGVSRKNTPAFDLREAIRKECEALGIAMLNEEVDCTSCSNGFFSYRARQDAGRQVMAIWRKREWPSGAKERSESTRV